MNKFQELMLDQFAKLFKKFQGLQKDVSTEFTGIKVELAEIKNSQIRMENKFNDQITALHDFRVGQEQINQEIKDALTTLGTKVEELPI